MTHLRELVQYTAHEEFSRMITPEINLLWACYERALRDLELNKYTDIPTMREAVAWFESPKENAYGFTFNEIKMHCNLSARAIKHTKSRVLRAKSALKDLIVVRRAFIRPKVQVPR